MKFDMTPEQARELLRKVMPFSYTELSADEAHAILVRIDEQNLHPHSVGMSLHCWNSDYEIDGKQYQVIGEISSSALPSVMLVTPT
jgi:hypothetical protein